MADNLSLNASTSATIASDDIGGVAYQRVKLTHGVDGVAMDASATNPMPVTLGSESVAVTIASAVEIANDAGSPVPISGTVEITNDVGNAIPVSGTVTVNAIPAGTNTIGNVGLTARTSGGATPSHYVSAASTNATSVKASAGQVFGIVASNVNAAARYLKLYNKASAPTVGTDVPVLTIILPGATTGGGVALNFPIGIVFSTGIAFAITTGLADTDTGAVAASDLVVNLLTA